jgi:hypothetical protein
MRIDYCPKCKKAGLKCKNNEGQTWDGHGQLVKSNQITAMCNPWDIKWCPRCKVWVVPDKKEWARKI